MKKIILLMMKKETQLSFTMQEIVYMITLVNSWYLVGE